MHHTTTTGGPAGPRPSTRPPRHALVTLLATLAGSSAALWALTGPPAVPRFTGWPGLSDVLTGAAVEQAWLVALAAATAWLLIGYLAAIVVLRAALLAGQSLVGGTRWVRTGMWLSDLITVPAIRRIVDGGVAGVLFVSGSLSVPPRALPGPPPVPVLAAAVPHAEEAAAAPASPLTRPGAAHLEYTVVGGDSLWAIAERFYDDGARYLDLVAANPSILGDPAIIEPGWRLAIPLPVAGLEVTDVARYRVAAGDDLWSLAARFLGDGFRWPEIDVLNRGHVMSDGRVFADPNVIAPGWMIELPLTVRAAVSPSPVVTTPVPSATTDPAMPTTAPTVIATPESPAASPLPAAPPAPAPDPDRTPVAADEPTFPTVVAVTAAGFLVIGGAVVFVHRRRRGVALPEPPGHAPEPAVGDAGRVTDAARALSGALAAAGIPAAPVLLHESRHGVAATFVAAPGLGDQFVAVRDDLARALDCAVRVDRGGDSIRVTLVGLRHLAAALQPVPGPVPLIVPVGADEDGIVYADLGALGGLVLSVPVEEQRRCVRAWAATLVTTHAPDELVLRSDRAASEWLGDVADAPHFFAIGGAPASDRLIVELEELIDERRADAGDASHGEHVLAFVGEAPATGAIRETILRGRGVDVVTVGPGGDAPDPALPRIRPPRLGEADAGGLAELVLEIPGLAPRPLEWVHVRRDQSIRWQPDDRTEPAPPVETEAPESAEDPMEEDLASAAVIEPPAPVPPALAPAADSAPAVSPSPPVTVVPAPDRDDPPPPAVVSPAPSRFDEAPPPDPSPGRRRVRTRAAARGVPRTTAPVAEASVPDDPAPSLPDDRSSRQMAMFAGGDATPAAVVTSDGAVTVRCFGGLEILVAGEPLGDWSYHKAPELLAFMVAQGRSVGREQIANALWPDLPWDRHVGHSLSNVVSYLRRRLREATARSDLRVMRSTRQGRYELDRALFATDLDGFELALRRAASAPPELALHEYDRAFALYTGEFLAGLPLEWAEGYRAEYRERFRGAAQKAAALAQRQGAAEQVIRYQRLVLGQEPTDEIAARGLMEALAATGDLTGARRVYRELGDAIQHLLDDPRAAPDPETRAVLGRLVEAAQDA